jgi:phospholipid-binding lipoprotein MlaA
MSSVVLAALALLSDATGSPNLPQQGLSSLQLAEIQSGPQTPPIAVPAKMGPEPEPVVSVASSTVPSAVPVEATMAAVAAASPAPPPQNEPEAIVVTGRAGPPPGDPVEVVNEVSYGAVQAVDMAIIAPITHGYDKATPGPAKKGLFNALNNLNEPVVFLNYLLQLKIGKAAETAGRFAVNSTIGVGGLMDVAKKKPFNLPRRSNGFGDTLGFYGIGPGPYLFLPLIGATNVRDMLGRVADLSVLPVGVGKPFSEPLVSLGKGTLSSLDDRLRNDEILQRVQKSDRPYAAMREYYMKKRAAQIDVIKGKRCIALLGLDELDLIYKGDLLAQGQEPRKADGIKIILPNQAPVCENGVSAAAAPK